MASSSESDYCIQPNKKQRLYFNQPNQATDNSETSVGDPEDPNDFDSDESRDLITLKDLDNGIFKKPSPRVFGSSLSEEDRNVNVNSEIPVEDPEDQHLDSDESRDLITLKDLDSEIFKKPSSVICNSLSKEERNTVTASESEESSPSLRSYQIVDSNTNLIHNITAERKKVDITVPDEGPRFYNVKPPYCTATIDPSKIPDAFEALPKVGAVSSKQELVAEQKRLLREFLEDDVDDARFNILESYCSPDNLRLGNELKLSSQTPTQSFFTEDMDLLEKANRPTVGEGLLRSVDKYRMKQELDSGQACMKTLKYRGMRVVPLHAKNKIDKLPLQGDYLEPGKDLLFRIRIYRPFAYNPKERVTSNGRHPLLAYDLVALGRQPLRLLRERILCVNDVGLRLDVSQEPAQAPPVSCKELFPSGHLFINNTFYVDRRSPCSDLTEPVRAWAEAKGIGTFKVKDLDGVTFQDLKVKLGHPEVYVHQGSCEHLFTFSEIRLVSATDPLTLSHYPCHTVVSRCQAVYCTTCAEYAAKYLVIGSDLVPFDPALFCETCLQLYLYKDGKKIADFKVYNYHYNDVGINRT